MSCSFHEALGICHTAKKFSRTTPAPGKTNFVKNIRERHHLPQHCIGNMDETAIWADMSTIAVRGSKSVPILTTGHEKQRITVHSKKKIDACH